VTNNARVEFDPPAGHALCPRRLCVARHWERRRRCSAARRRPAAACRVRARCGRWCQDAQAVEAASEDAATRTKKPRRSGDFLKRMKGLEPSTFCMASVLCAGSERRETPVFTGVWRVSAVDVAQHFVRGLRSICGDYGRAPFSERMVCAAGPLVNRTPLGATRRSLERSQRPPLPRRTRTGDPHTPPGSTAHARIRQPHHAAVPPPSAMTCYIGRKPHPHS
jgi:hypothetical protein